MALKNKSRSLHEKKTGVKNVKPVGIAVKYMSGSVQNEKILIQKLNEMALQLCNKTSKKCELRKNREIKIEAIPQKKLFQ